jgi:hypothetical protein
MTAYARLAVNLALLLVACASAGVMADTLYKSTDSDGRVIYSDKPVPGAVEIEGARSVPIDPENAARIEEERKKLRQQGEEFEQRERKREQALDDAQAEVNAAMDALKEAQRRREAGVEPLPGERLGDAGGGSRLAPSYFERLRTLDGEVGAAQQRVDQAYARRNDVR